MLMFERPDLQGELEATRPGRGSFHPNRLLLVAAWVFLCVAAARGADDDSWLNLGPAWDSFETVFEPGQRVEAGGPFYYRQHSDTARIWAVPPLLSYSADPATEMVEFNFLYPVFSSIRYGQQYRIHLFQLLSWAGGPTQTETERRRFTLFPLYFHQSSSDPSQVYTAYGPFYGDLKGRLFKDEIHYVMFPLYSKTRKKDVVTWNYVYPLFHLREGNGLTGWQFWPFYGTEHKEITRITNRFGDLETIGGWDKKFVLWPIFNTETSGIGTENREWQQALLPLYSLTRSPLRDATTVIWPLFSKIEDRGRGYVEWQTPWPLVVFASGPGKTTKRVLPFFNVSSSTNQTVRSYMWPVYRRSTIYSPPLDRRRTQILFFLFSDANDISLETGKNRRRIDLLPLFTHRKDYNGYTRTQILAPIEPILPNNHNIELEYSHFWSLWLSQHNPNTGKSSHSLLWNLYRDETSPESKRVSFLFGLYQRKKDASGTETRLAFVPIHRSKTSSR